MVLAARIFPLLLAFVVCFSIATAAFPEDKASLLAVTPDITAYATGTVKPVLDACPGRDELSLLLKVSEVLNDPEKGIGVHKIDPSGYFIYNLFDKIWLGFLYAWKFSPEQRNMLQRWHAKYMRDNSADVFFAPSADEIVKSRAAFGCTHHARAFIAVVKALGLIRRPEDLRYVVSSKADDYNRLLEKGDHRATINGHQFVLTRIGSGWVAINTSKSERTAMPADFSPDSLMPPQNIAVRFESYPARIVFLLRKIGKDFNDDCGDDSLSHLMNISRSGDPQDAAFKWDKFGF